MGTYDEIALGKLLTGKKAGCEVSISGLYENVNGSSTPKDFETMMQLMYLRFMEPRFDTLAHKVIIERNHIYAKQLAARIEKAYRDRICDASDFTFFIVGNVDKDTVRVMAQKYIGSLPSLYRNEKWVDRQVRAPKGKVEKNIEIPLEVPKSTVIVLFTFECDPEKANELKPLLYKEVDNIIREGVTEEELSKVVKNTLKEAEQSKQHNAYWLTTLVTYYKTGVNLNDPKNMETLVASIQPKDVQKFAKKFFKDADVIDLIFSPQQK